MTSHQRSSIMKLQVLLLVVLIIPAAVSYDIDDVDIDDDSEEPNVRDKRFIWKFVANCPQQTDFSQPFMLSSNATGYPAEAINNETKTANLTGCLNLFNTSSTDPKIPEDPMLVNVTKDLCPADMMVLRNYRGDANDTCWVILGIQPTIHFAVCRTTNCLTFRSRSWLSNRCLRVFKSVPVVAFCGDRPDGQRIVMDRVIVPTSCTCVGVKCRRVRFW
ncbi:uncharacterized protein LOC124266854 [Haliotis rubra]|uniref:uncharacterized protein LOC124266854 n=1 Tax=Haliotis rubra TaxID=36100 RepID=UPI001EE62CB7|nr:uncharacterized protein LOC124266854 [Haliotis rubra]